MELHRQAKINVIIHDQLRMHGWNDKTDFYRFAVKAS
jgi:hypothetical protein